MNSVALSVVTSKVSRQIMGSLLSLLIIAEAPLAVAGQGQVVHDVSGQLKRIGGTKASFCFAVENGAVTGYNENEPVRAASVTKTLTTFWATEGLWMNRGPGQGANFQYATKVYVQPSTHEMHIEGARDPFFDRDRMFALLADLNVKGVTQINRLTFDSNFWYWPEATEFRYFGGAGKTGGGKHSGHHGIGPTIKKIARAVTGKKHRGRRPSSVDRAPAALPYSLGQKPFRNWAETESHTDRTVAGDSEKVKKYLGYSFNTPAWPAAFWDRYHRARALNPALGLPEKLNMKVGKVDIDPGNPLKGKPGVYEFVILSAPLKMYLKFMNIYSVNPYAEELFFSLGGKQRFMAFMNRFNMAGAVSNVNSGSGVNLHGANRFDSLVSCSTVVKMIRKMDQDLEHSGMDLSDVMAVPGNDHGSWHDPSKTLIVKTGTLKHPTPSKNLAGVEETTAGEVYFGIFIDRRGGVSGNMDRAVSALRRNFTGVQVKERPYSFSPLGPWSHLKLASPDVQVARH